jgi:hypothetical protein
MGGANVQVPSMGSSWVREVESVAVLVPAQGDANGHIRKVALLEGEHVEAHWARDVVGERVHHFSISSVEGARRLMASETEHQEQFEELSLLWSWGVKLCLSIIGPSQVMSHLPTRMRATALHHAGVVGELTALRVAVSSTAEVVLGRAPSVTSRVEVMNELTIMFQELEELCVGGHKMHIFTANLPTFHSRYRR